MASVKKRRFKSGVAWFGRYNAGKDATGKTIWKVIRTGQPTRTKAAAWIEAFEKAEKEKRENPVEHHLCGALMDEWMASLRNRNADDDRLRVKKHLRPRFEHAEISKVTVAVLIKWIDAMKAKGDEPGAKFSSATQRQCLNLMSRFMSWATARDYIAANPCRSVPHGERPKQAPKIQDQPWTGDDAQVRKIIHSLNHPQPRPRKRPPKNPPPPEPSYFGYAYYLCNRCGLRLGEAFGLRLSDLSFLNKEIIRVRFSWGGPLKEDKNGEGKVKWAPAPDDAIAFLGPWLDKRRAEGAGEEDLVFPPMGIGLNDLKPATNYDKAAAKRTKVAVNRAWRRLPEELRTNMTWYEASRHSYVSSKLSAGARFEEVSSAVGHSSPVITQRYYNRYVRKDFSPVMRTGLGLGADHGLDTVRPLHGTQRGTRVENRGEKISGESENSDSFQLVETGDPDGI